MCKPKKPKPVEIPDPVYVRNAYLDDSFSPLNAQKTGRAALRIPLGGNGLEVARGPGVGIAPPSPSRKGKRNPADEGRVRSLINARF